MLQQAVVYRYEEDLRCQGDGPLAQAAQRGGGISFSEGYFLPFRWKAPENTSRIEEEFKAFCLA